MGVAGIALLTNADRQTDALPGVPKKDREAICLTERVVSLPRRTAISSLFGSPLRCNAKSDSCPGLPASLYAQINYDKNRRPMENSAFWPSYIYRGCVYAASLGRKCVRVA